MKKLYFLFFTLIGLTSFGQVINEVDADTPGTDEAEFIEILWTPNTSLNDLSVVLFNGNGDNSYQVFDLDGFTTDANGFFILANSGITDKDLDIGASNIIQNGADAVALYSGDFISGDAVTSTNLISALVYDTSDGDDTDLLTGLGETVQYDEAGNGNKDAHSLQRQNDGSYAALPTTLRAANAAPSAATQVANVAALRAGMIGQSYELTGEVLMTFQQSFRNQKFIEDATGAILIDDDSGNITTSYSIGDGITGILGTLGEFGGMIQFIPSEDPGAASSTGNVLTPQAVSLLDLSTNPENYESELVKVTAVTMDNSVEPNFGGGLVQAMDQGGDAFNFRSTFFDADYADQGVAVPTDPTDITGIVNERNGNAYFLTARDAADFSLPILSANEFVTAKFSLYPNPTNTGFVAISSTNSEAMKVQVYDILGKRVKNVTLTNETLNVSDLKSGVYIVKIAQNNASITKKLVVK